MEITYYFKSRDPESKIVGTFGLKIPKWDITFTNMKLIKTLNGGLFVAGPSYESKDKEGNKQYRDYWYFGKDTGARFKEKVLKLVEEHIKEKFGEKSLTEQYVPYSEDIF